MLLGIKQRAERLAADRAQAAAGDLRECGCGLLPMLRDRAGVSLPGMLAPAYRS